jgi:hypothetical protein
MDWKNDPVLAVPPTYHIHGVSVLATRLSFLETNQPIMLYRSCMRHSQPRLQKYTIAAFVRVVYNDSITNIYVALPVGLHLAKDPAMTQACLSSLRVVTSDGAPLPQI